MKMNKRCMVIATLSIILISFFLYPSKDLNNESSKFTNKEYPNLSSNEIIINTPLNITYNEPMDGYYHATYGFENDEPGSNPEDWSINEPSGTSIQIENQVNSHNNVLSIRDWNSGAESYASNTFNSEVTYGTIEFWFCAAGTSSPRTIDFRAGNGNIHGASGNSNNAFNIYFDGNTMVVRNGTNNNIANYSANQWYHIRIDFECTTEGYNGLGQYETRYFVNGDDKGLFNFWNVKDNITGMAFESWQWGCQTDEKVYFDAIGYSWDPHYNVGDNHNETILLSYDTEMDLDWEGYSLDGQENVTIYGNTTLPILNNGLHSIQVFGNDSMGNDYESDIRYFTTTYSNLNPPLLTKESLNPLIGDQITEFNFTVLYTDENNDAPYYINVVINQTSYPMVKLFESDDNYTDGCLFYYLTYLLPSEFNYSYYFECSDGVFTNTTSTYTNLKVDESNFYHPELVSPNVAPIIGNHTTMFNFTVWYFDDDNNFPTYVNITLNSTTFSMQPVDSNDLTAYDGIEFTFQSSLEVGYYQLQINCSDGLFNNATDWIYAPEVNPFYSTSLTQLLSPLNGSASFSSLFSFTWQSFEASFGEVNYTLQISTQEDFVSTLLEVNNIEENPSITNFTHYIDYPSGCYYWRVRPHYYGFTGDWSETYNFNLIYNENSPILNSPSIEPFVGDQYTLFNFSIIYQDLDNNSPYSINVIINETIHSMSIANPLDNDFTDGCIYYFESTLPFSEVNYTYSFECSDGKYNTSTITYDNLEVNQGNNYSPQLLDPHVSPQIGNLSYIYHFQVEYMDPDDNFPEYVNITIDGQIHTMLQVNPLDIIAVDGILYYYETTLDIGLHSFQITCFDGNFYNSTLLLAGPDVNPFYEGAAAQLYEPAPYSHITTNIINFSWYSLDLMFGSVNYTLQISNLFDFSVLNYEITDIIENDFITSVLIPVSLSTDDFYWRVKPTFGNYSGTWSKPSRFSYFINLDAPLLALGEITPSTGSASTVFKITVIYSDSDNNAPEYVNIIIDGISFNMTKADPIDDNFIDGCLFQYLTLMEPSDTACIISFQCSDGAYQFSTQDSEGPFVDFDDTPSTPGGINNYDLANLITIFTILGITFGSLLPFIALAELSSKKIKLADTEFKKIKKKKIKN